MGCFDLMPRIQKLNRTQLAVVLGQGLSFLLIITFIFANRRYALLASIGGAETTIPLRTAYVSACLIGLVGAFSIWITLHYLSKSNALREMVVVCAWTHQIKVDGRWISFRSFLTDQLGYAVSHGVCEQALSELRDEVELDWKRKSAPDSKRASAKPLGITPVDADRPPQAATPLRKAPSS